MIEAKKKVCFRKQGPEIKTYHKSIMIKILWCWLRNKQIIKQKTVQKQINVYVDLSI